MSSSSSSQDSSKQSEPEFIDLFGRDQLSNITREQFASLNEIPNYKPTVKVSSTKKSQDLTLSDSDDSSSNGLLYNKDFSCSIVAKSKYVDNKTDFDRFIKLYCMYIGTNGISVIDDRLDKIVKSKHSVLKKKTSWFNPNT
jgi:hypothetical protein